MHSFMKAKTVSLLLAVGLFLGLSLVMAPDCLAQKKKKKGKSKIAKVEEPGKPDLTKVINGEWGKTVGDSIENVKKYSLYREFYKQGSYADALPYWRHLYTTMPSVRKTPLVDGEKMFTQFIIDEIEGPICEDGTQLTGTDKNECKEKGGLKEWKFKDETKVKAYVDTLYDIYATRVKYFGEQGYVLDKHSKFLVKYFPALEDSIFNLRKKSIEIEAEDADYVTVYNYFNSLLRKVKTKEMTIDELNAAYEPLADIMDYNINNNEDEKRLEKYEKYGTKMEETMEKLNTRVTAASTTRTTRVAVTDCPTAVQQGRDYFNTGDLDGVKRAYSVLKKNRCTSDPLYMDVLIKLAELDPSGSRLRYVAVQYQKNKDYSNAVRFYEKSLEFESDPTKKASTYLKLAKISQVQKKYSKARQHARKAAELRAGWGEPLMLIGNLYASSAGSCSDDGLGGRSAYWAAVDMYSRAKDIDPAVDAEARQKIGKYAAHFPDKGQVFMALNKNKGDSYKVGCWIQVTTRVR